MAAILNFSKTIKILPAYLHIIENMIVKIEYFLSFCAYKNEIDPWQPF